MPDAEKSTLDFIAELSKINSDMTRSIQLLKQLAPHGLLVKCRVQEKHNFIVSVEQAFELWTARRYPMCCNRAVLAEPVKENAT